MELQCFNVFKNHFNVVMDEKFHDMYFVMDKETNGGEADFIQISDLVPNRYDPKSNPLALMSCSDEDSEVKWMKKLEEGAPYCEYDDFVSEANEVHGDQVKVFPDTKGFYLISQLVGAMNPEDLDAMDESVPLIKWTLDNLLGIEQSDMDYRRYFDGIKAAQKARKINSAMDRVKIQLIGMEHTNNY